MLPSINVAGINSMTDPPDGYQPLGEEQRKRKAASAAIESLLAKGLIERVCGTDGVEHFRATKKGHAWWKK